MSLNVTVTNTAGSGFATVYPCGSRPNVSSLNYPAGGTVANAVIVGLAWIATYYVSGEKLPVSALTSWNLVVGFTLIVTGVMLSTKWR